MEYISISKEMQELINRISENMRQLWKLSIAKAESERAYRVGLQQEILALRTDGFQATLIPDIARGATSELKFERDKNKALYDTTKDSLRALQASLNAYQTIVRFQEDIEKRE